MAKKQFDELAVGAVFTFNNKEYTKMQPEKVSCCRSLNAAEVPNPSIKIFVRPQDEVEVNE